MSRVPRIAAFVAVFALPIGAGVAAFAASIPDPPRVPSVVRIGESPAPAPSAPVTPVPGQLPPPPPVDDDDDGPDHHDHDHHHDHDDGPFDDGPLDDIWPFDD
ncbi:hypothetical protein [Amycolatopsis sp. NPDC058986]|uniref:hypothetical protein n=1 Tax=unclassified Amycolatopsis TaxID=2618356 RepID=UPI00366D70BB